MACTVEHCSWSATAPGISSRNKQTLTRSGSPSLPRALLIMLLSICLFCLVYCTSHRQWAANVLPLGLFGSNLCHSLHSTHCTTLLVIRVIHNTCWWPLLHPLHMTRSPFHLVLTALRCEGMIVLKMDNAWNIDIIKTMHLCSAHTVCCARKVRKK